ncbi:MAG: transposase [Deltaproteobacteria bacterium]|nr:transposase [Deltaproteobacteria bacterium]
MKRAEVTAKTPLHLTMRLKEKLPTLRRKFLLKEFQKCVHGAKAHGLSVIHFSIQYNHVHLIAETRDNKALALGMRSLASRFGKIIRSYSHQTGFGSKGGSVFKGRYHLHALRTPLETRNALRYVLLNFSKHEKLVEHVDEYSSARFFRNWTMLLGKKFKGPIRTDAHFYSVRATARDAEEWGLSHPRSWLASRGWMRAAA